MDARTALTLLAGVFLLLSAGSAAWTLASSLARPDRAQRHPHLTRLVALLCVLVTVAAGVMLAAYWRGEL